MVRPHQPGETDFRSVLPEDIDWKPFPAFPPSVRLADVVGDPTKPGPYVIRVKAPSGVKLMPHRHPEDRIYTVISGIFYIGLGDRFDFGTNLLGGDALMRASRRPEILADAAYLIFIKPAREFTGRFLIDDTSFAENCVTEFDRYRVDPTQDLAVDFFVPDDSVAPAPLARPRG